MDCEHDFIYVKFTCSNNQLQLRKQCFKCGYSDNINYKKTDVENINILPEYDRNKLLLYYESERLKRRENEILIQNQKYEDFKKEMAIYYQTVKWENKRKKVLKRDNYLCQSCLERPATQAHHLTYENFKREPLFQLISVCELCHEAIHKLKNYE